MPNPSSIQDQFSQNGHYRSDQNLSEEVLDLTNPKRTSPETQSKSSESLGDDWSSLTQELIDTLPRVWTRGLLYFLVVFAGIVLPWAMLSKVDETGSARGRLEPKGATQRLDAPAAGTVTQVRVKEGQTVKAGQVLMELESDVLRSDLQQVQTKLEGQLNRLAQLQLIENQLAIAIRAQQQQNQAQELEKLAQVEQARANLSASQTAYTLQAEISSSKSQIKSLEFQLGQRVLRAPIEGTIFQFPIQRAGAVVQPGQAIAQIAQKGAVLVFKAQMPIPESGFLREGMPVKLKFDAYPFQDYGVVQGYLRWISPDSKPMQTAQGQVEMFELEITLEKTYIQTQNKRIALTPGQTATAEVIVRQRRLIDFILDPFKKLQKGGLEL